MRKIAVSDITMKQAGKSADFSLSFKEKIELSKLLDKLEVSVIELDGISNPKVDSLLIKSIAAAVKKSAVAVPVSLEEGGAQLVWNALKEAKHPRLQVAVPVSPVQMEYLAHKKPAAMLAAVEETIRAGEASDIAGTTVTERLSYGADGYRRVLEAMAADEADTCEEKGDT